MVYTVTQLVTDAFTCSGIVGKEFEQVSGEQQEEGFQYLNSILAKKTADKSGIPYFLRYSSNFVIGQEQYTIPGLIDISSLTFFIDSPPSTPIVPPPPYATMPVPAVTGQSNQVRYSMRKVDRKLYWATPRANQIMSLPYQYYVERQYGGATNTQPGILPNPLGGASIFVYFLPVAAYTFEIWGLFSLNSVVMGQDLSETLDQFYIDFLKFELAERICAEYDYSMPPGAAKQLSEYQLIIDKREQRLDLTQQSISPLAQITDGINYAWANLSTGWSVP
jgi:hypothetical protein